MEFHILYQQESTTEGVNFHSLFFILSKGLTEVLMDFLTTHLGEGTVHHTSKGTQYSYVCPFCNDHKERLFVNVDRQVFICHNCETSGRAITLISMLEGITWKQALEQYRSEEGYYKPLPESLEQEVFARLSAKEDTVDSRKYVYPLPEEFILL